MLQTELRLQLGAHKVKKRGMEDMEFSKGPAGAGLGNKSKLVTFFTF